MCEQGHRVTSDLSYAGAGMVPWMVHSWFPVLTSCAICLWHCQ